MKKLLSFAVFCLTALIIVSFFSCSSQAPKANLKTDIDSLSYAYGVNLTQGLDQYLQSMGIDSVHKGELIKGILETVDTKKENKSAQAHLRGVIMGEQVANIFTNINEGLFGPDSTSTQSLNKSQFLAGFIAAALNKDLLIKSEDATTFVQAKSEQVYAQANEKTKMENQAFLNDNKTKEGVVVLPSGLQYKVEKEGKGPKPVATDMVKVKYKGMDIQGNVFESNEDATFGLSQVIKGWTEGIQLMPVGSKYTFYIPYDLAYGERGQQPRIGPFATLIFDVELVDIVKNK